MNSEQIKYGKIKYGKWILSFLYVLYLIITVLNVVFQLGDVHNGLVESWGALGYIITYGLDLLMSSGFFVVFTVIQLIIYHVNKQRVSNRVIPLLICEAIKIIGTSIYIYLIDYANIWYGGVITAFIILSIVIFAVISVLEIVMMIFMKISKN